MQVGRHLRTWMPIFVYACPVTALAAALLTVGGLVVDSGGLVGADRHGVLGWLASASYAPWVVYLAVGPGLVGHTGGWSATSLALQPMHRRRASDLGACCGNARGQGRGAAQQAASW